MRSIHIKYHSATYILYGLVILTLVSGFVLSNLGSSGLLSSFGLFSSSASAVTSDMEISQAAVIVSATCSMASQVANQHIATIPNGQYSGDNGSYSNGIGETTIDIRCNDASGYSIYAVGFTNNQAGNNKLVNSSLTGFDIVTGTATSGDVSNWSMKVISDSTSTFPPTITDAFKDTATGNSVFTAVPSDYTKVAYLDNHTTSTTNRSTIKATYAAYISPDQPAGAYAGQVAYLLVHPNSNEPADDTFLAMQNVSQWGKNITIGQEVTAIDSRDGKAYTVARLCMDTSDQKATNCVAGNTDEHDTYSKLWMTENLDFTIDNTKTYTHGDTDLGWSEESFDTAATWTPSVSTVASLPDAAFNYRNTGNTSEDPDYIAGWLGSTSNNTYQAEAKDSSGNEIYVYPNGTNNGIKYVGLDSCVSAVMLSDSSLTRTAATADCKHYHIGNYYNWSAAVATDNTSAYTQDKYAMPNSICPAGWRLPNGLTTTTTTDEGTGISTTTNMSEFNQLLKANEVVGTTLNADGVDLSGSQNVGYASDAFVNKMIASPLYFVRSGYLNGSTLYNFSLAGYYWSSTVVSAYLAYYLSFNSGNLNPANRSSRDLGRSVRCLAR